MHRGRYYRTMVYKGWSSMTKYKFVQVRSIKAYKESCWRDFHFRGSFARVPMRTQNLQPLGGWIKIRKIFLKSCRVAYLTCKSETKSLIILTQQQLMSLFLTRNQRSAFFKFCIFIINDHVLVN